MSFLKHIYNYYGREEPVKKSVIAQSWKSNTRENNMIQIEFQDIHGCWKQRGQVENRPYQILQAMKSAQNMNGGGVVTRVRAVDSRGNLVDMIT